MGSGTFEHEVVAALEPADGELVLDKNTSSAFNSTGIEWLLRNMDVETLVVVGMATDMWSRRPRGDAADRGFNVILVEDATGRLLRAPPPGGLSGFARVFGQIWTPSASRRVAARQPTSGTIGIAPDDGLAGAAFVTRSTAKP